MKYRKKPVVIEAHQVPGESEKAFALRDVLRKRGANIDLSVDKSGMSIVTLEGTMHANIGDWIIQGVAGEFYPCKPDIFEQTYEEVQDAK
jgi:hypothetical protein